MVILKTIASAKTVFQTANRPILVSCSDEELRLWVVKSSRGKTPAYSLAKELIAYRFAELWKLPQPKAALISVNPNHLEKVEVNKEHYKQLCFGSQYLPNRQDWDKFMVRASKAFHRKFFAHKMLLTISIFDIWLGNEDRFAQNHNLLLELNEDQYRVLPIDHETILNATDSNNNRIFYDSEMMIPDPGYNLLESLSVIAVLRRCRNIDEMKREVLSEFPNFVKACKVRVPEILSELPEGWEIEKESLNVYLNEQLFRKGWLELVKEHFSKLLAQATK